MTPGDKDICVRVYLSGADWIGLRELAEYHGMSQSAFFRSMLRHAIEHHARQQIAADRRSEDRADMGME